MAPDVAGSIPVSHPNPFSTERLLFNKLQIVTNGPYDSLSGPFADFGLEATLFLSSFRGRAVQQTLRDSKESGAFCFAPKPCQERVFNA